MTRPEAPERVFDEQHRTITVGLLALVTMFAFEAVAVSLAMPSVARDLGGETLYPIAVIGMLTAAIVGMVVGGIWGAARGAALPVTIGGLGFVAGLLVSGFAGSMEVLVGGRLLQGLGGGAALTALYVAVGDAYPPRLRTRIFSLFATAWVLPSIAGPFVAGALVDLFGWRSVFLVVAGFALFSILAVRRPMSRHLAVRDAPLVWGRRPLYAVIAATGVVALHLAGHGSGVRSGLLLLAGLLVVAVAAGPLLPRGTTRASRGLPAVIASRGLFGAAFACVELFLPLVLQVETGMSPTLSGLVMMVGALGWVAGSAYSGKHAEPESFPRIMRIGSLSLLVGTIVILVLVPIDHLPVLAPVVATLGIAIMAVGMGLSTPLMSTLSLDLAPVGRQGDTGAAIQMSDSLGQSIAAGLVGAVFARWFLIDQDTSYLAGFGMAALLAVVATVTVGRSFQKA
jgi:MFS family permease